MVAKPLPLTPPLKLPLCNRLRALLLPVAAATHGTSFSVLTLAKATLPPSCQVWLSDRLLDNTALTWLALDMYHGRTAQSATATASAREPATPEKPAARKTSAWNEFQSSHKGEGLSASRMASLYREQQHRGVAATPQVDRDANSKAYIDERLAMVRQGRPVCCDLCTLPCTQHGALSAQKCLLL